MSAKTAIRQWVIAVFVRFIEHDALLQSQINAFGKSLKIIDGCWQFQLQHLHQFLTAQLPTEKVVDYRCFRNAIYDSDINAQLANHNAIIKIIKNNGKTDRNIYQLVIR